MRLSACGQVCSYPLITFALFICVVVCAGPFLSAVHLLLALVVPVSVDLCRASRVASFSWCCGAPLFRCCCSVFCCSCCLFVGCPCGLVLAVWPALSCCPPLPSPFGCLLVFSGPVSVLLVPPSGYLVVSATVRLSYLWCGVSWLIGSYLHSAPWQQRLRPCVGLCPLHHVVGVVHVPLAPSRGIRLRVIQFTLRTPLKLHAPASLASAAFFLLSCCLPGRLLSPSLLVSACFLLPASSFCWALSARLVVLCLGWCLWLLLLCVFGLSSWRSLFCGLFGLLGFVVLFVPGWFLCFVFCFWWLLLTSYWTGTLVYILISPAQLRPLS